MSRLNLLVSAEFLDDNYNLSWAEISFGFANGWLGWKTVIDLAVHRLMMNENPSSLEVDLASVDRSTVHEIDGLLGRLANTSKISTAAEKRSLWLHITLNWIVHNRETLIDIWPIVEFVYADFGYPYEMDGLITWRPLVPFAVNEVGASRSERALSRLRNLLEGFDPRQAQGPDFTYRQSVGETSLILPGEHLKG